MPSLLPSTAIPLGVISRDAGDITANYTEIGSYDSWTDYAYIISDLDELVNVSFDGDMNHLLVPAGAVIELNLKANNLTLSTRSFWVKRAFTPTTGTIYVCGFSGTYQ